MEMTGDALEKSWYTCCTEGLLEAEAPVSEEEPPSAFYCVLLLCSEAARTGLRFGLRGCDM
jgi:hypothetical protein